MRVLGQNSTNRRVLYFLGARRIYVDSGFAKRGQNPRVLSFKFVLVLSLVPRIGFSVVRILKTLRCLGAVLLNHHLHQSDHVSFADPAVELLVLGASHAACKV
jgi:hypothetical protein